MTDTEKPVTDELLETGGNGKNGPVFHYSREHRLSHASPTVQALNEGQPIRPGLLKSIFANKGNKLILSAVIMIFLISSLASRFSGGDSDSDTGNVSGMILGGNTLAMTIHNEEGVLLLRIIKQAPQSGELYIGMVDIAVSPAMPRPGENEAPGVPQVFTHRILFNPVDSEFFHLTLPFDGDDFFVVLKTDNEQKSIRLRTGGT